MASVWGELKRRNVVKVAIAYAIVGWLLLQLTDVLQPILTLPEWIGRMVFFFLLIGFPVALIFAWAFELTPEGVKREKHVDRSQSITQSTGRKLDFTIILEQFGSAHFQRPAGPQFGIHRTPRVSSHCPSCQPG